LTKFKKGAYYMGIGLYNHLPKNIKDWLETFWAHPKGISSF
jgi:hypothetical protein